MAISFVGAAGRLKKGSDEDARKGGGGNPDDQSYRHHIGDPKDAANDDSYADWKKSGHVSKREFDRDVMGDLRRAGMSARKRAILETVGEGFKDKDHGVTGLRKDEAIEFVEGIRDEASKLGFNKKDVGRLEKAVGDAINS